MDYLNQFLFGYYPYICLTVFLLGSLMRFEREQYTWRASSSQILRKKQLMWGSNLFHVGILFLFFGHLVGLLTPHVLSSISSRLTTSRCLPLSQEALPTVTNPG